MHNDAYFFTNEFSSFDLFFYCSFHISFNTKRGLIWLLVDFFFFSLVHIDSKALAQDRLWSEHTKKRKEKLSRDFFSLWIAPQHYPSGPSVFLCQHQRAIRHCHPCLHLRPLLNLVLLQSRGWTILEKLEIDFWRIEYWLPLTLHAAKIMDKFQFSTKNFLMVQNW